MWWGGEGQDVHAAFVSVPDGAVTDASVHPRGLPGTYGASYEGVSHKWLGVSANALSPDRSRYAYWTGTPAGSEVHVVDVATKADSVVYSGLPLYVVVGFGPDAIYLTHAIQLRRGSFERLYRLDQSGGTPQLVTGSDRHMYQWGWVLVADGAAWGIDNRVVGNDHFYSVLRLDLATSQVTQWMEGPPNTMSWPMGVDGMHRLYVAPINGPLWRIDSPGHSVELASPADVTFGNSIGGPTSFVADSHGVWFSGKSAVWLSADGRAPQQFAVAPAREDVWPAGPCV